MHGPQVKWQALFPGCRKTLTSSPHLQQAFSHVSDFDILSSLLLHINYFTWKLDYKAFLYYCKEEMVEKQRYFQAFICESSIGQQMVFSIGSRRLAKVALVSLHDLVFGNAPDFNWEIVS